MLRGHYRAGPAANAPLETLTATARLGGDRLEIWAPTQAPGLARAAAARVAGLDEAQVTLYPTLAGGGYGRKLETRAIEQAAMLAMRTKRPVQLDLVAARGERPGHVPGAGPGAVAGAARPGRRDPRLAGADRRARHRRPAGGAAARRRRGDGGDRRSRRRARCRLTPSRPWRSTICPPRPASGSAAGARARTATPPSSPRASWTSWRGSPDVEPLSFRMQMLGDNPRLARCLTTAATLGGWDGGPPGSAMGIACHSAFGSHIATLVEVEVTAEQRIRVLRAVCAVDCGRIVNPDLVRQQIEGGLVFGIAAATGKPIGFERGRPDVRGFRSFRLPDPGRLARRHRRDCSRARTSRAESPSSACRPRRRPSPTRSTR